jgi:flagellar protein FliT
MSKALIDFYKSIEESSRQMLEAAKAQDWEQVVKCEGVCAVLIEQLRATGRAEQLLPEQRMEKNKIMQRILSNDAQIRYLAEPWLDRLDPQTVGSPAFLH